MKVVRLFLIIAVVFKIAAAHSTTSDVEPIKSRTRRFVGGIEIVSKPRIFIVSIEYHGKHVCAGSIITDRVILTAASCTVQRWYKKFTVRVGSTHLESEGTLYQVAKMSLHPQFDNSSQINDVALLWLDQSIDYGTIHAEPIYLFDKSDQVVMWSKALSYGWNVFEGYETPLNRELMVVSVRIVPIKECAKVLDEKTRRGLMDKICVRSSSEKICSRDVGSPLIVNGLLAGITITDKNCTMPDLPVTYMRISRVQDWISTEILALSKLKRPPVVYNPLTPREIDSIRGLQGDKIKFEEASFLVSIITTVNNILTCTGTIIGPKYVLTSTRCSSAGLATFYVRSGSGNWTHGGQKHRIVDAKWHHDYKVNNLIKSSNDIAILQVEPPFTFGPTTTMVELYERDVGTDQGSLATIYGWDPTADKIRRMNRRPTKGLQSLNLTVIPSDECSDIFQDQGGLSGLGQICASSKLGMCIGQLGAPLMIGKRQAGIYIWGNEECADYRFPSVFTEISAYRDWIDDVAKYKYIKHDELR